MAFVQGAVAITVICIGITTAKAITTNAVLVVIPLLGQVLKSNTPVAMEIGSANENRIKQGSEAIMSW